MAEGLDQNATFATRSASAVYAMPVIWCASSTLVAIVRSTPALMSWRWPTLSSRHANACSTSFSPGPIPYPTAMPSAMS